MAQAEPCQTGARPPVPISDPAGLQFLPPVPMALWFWGLRPSPTRMRHVCPCGARDGAAASAMTQAPAPAPAATPTACKAGERYVSLRALHAQPGLGTWWWPGSWLAALCPLARKGARQRPAVNPPMGGPGPMPWFRLRQPAMSDRAG